MSESFNFSFIDGRRGQNRIEAIMEELTLNGPIKALIVPAKIIVPEAKKPYYCFSIYFISEKLRTLVYGICEISGYIVSQYTRRFVLWPLLSNNKISVSTSWNKKEQEIKNLDKLVADMEAYIANKLK